MSITRTTSYTGRQVDMELLKTIIAPTGSTPVTLSLSANAQKTVAGPQKAVQRYAVLLLSALGTVEWAPKQGTRFLPDLMRGGGRSAGHLVRAFALANAAAIRQLQADDDAPVYGTTPPDERIVSGRLMGYTLNNGDGRVELRIALRTQAGDTFEYVVPTVAPIFKGVTSS